MTPVRVLVAEDNEDHRFLTLRALSALEELDLQVEGVADGVEALDFLHRRGEFTDRERPHLVLLDLKMPRKDGLEVLRELKGDPELKTIPVIVLTSSDRPEDIDSSYQLGGNSYVTKPASIEGFRKGLRCVATYWADRNMLPSPP